VKLFSPEEVRDIRTGVDSLTVFAPRRAIRHRGDTLNTPQLTLTFSSLIPDVLRVHLRHFQGGRKEARSSS
jgi:alpha-D-xyloside xylohydrolase